MSANVQASAETENETKECPKCAEVIKAKAQVCRFCNHDFAVNSEPSGPKTYLEEPVKVTSEKVFPSSGKGTAIRIKDVQHVAGVVPPKGGFQFFSFLFLVIGAFCLLGDSSGTVIAAITFGFMSVYTFFSQLTMAHSFVKFSTASGPIIWHFDDKSHAAKVRNAVEEAIAGTA